MADRGCSSAAFRETILYGRCCEGGGDVPIGRHPGPRAGKGFEHFVFWKKRKIMIGWPTKVSQSTVPELYSGSFVNKFHFSALLLVKSMGVYHKFAYLFLGNCLARVGSSHTHEVVVHLLLFVLSYRVG